MKNLLRIATVYSLLLSSLQAQQIYWADPGSHKIQRASLDGSNVEDLISGDPSITPFGLALDVPAGKIYFTDPDRRKVERANLDGSSRETLYTNILGGPSTLWGICLDLTGGKIYWTDQNANTIQRANLDGSGVQTFTDFGQLFTPQGIALDLAQGKMYWGHSSGVKRANLNLTSIENVALNNIGLGKGVALDLESGKIYWTNRNMSLIQRANLDGSSPETILSGAVTNRPREIVLDLSRGKMIWSSGGFPSAPGQIRQANLDGSNVETLVAGLVSPQGIALNLPLQLVSSIPPDGTIDARQPSEISGKNPTGISIVETIFSGDALQVLTTDFSVSEEGGDGVAPSISGIYYITPTELWLYLSEPIETEAWTTIQYLPTGQQIRLGYLPADANGDGTSSPVDILVLIDSLNGVTPRPIYSTDMNRSALAEPSDILRLIDLLNGAGAFEIWNGRELPD